MKAVFMLIHYYLLVLTNCCECVCFCCVLALYLLTQQYISYVLVWQWLMTMTNATAGPFLCWCDDWHHCLLYYVLVLLYDTGADVLMSIVCCDTVSLYFLLFLAHAAFPFMLQTNPVRETLGIFMSNSINSCTYSSAGHKHLTAYQFIEITLFNFSFHYISSKLGWWGVYSILKFLYCFKSSL